jgi:predicted dienelactone hydrolase
VRPLEILLLLAILLTFLALVAPLSPSLRWLRYSAPVALLIAGVQALVEGPRWQMVPAYLLGGSLFAVWIWQRGNRTGERSTHSPLRRSATVLGVVLGLLALAVSAVLPIIVPVIRFPQPTGPYAIGTLTYHWIDTDRPEIFTADPNDRRELMVQIWYPARADPSARRSPYIQDADAVARIVASLRNLPAFVFEQLKYVTTNAVQSASVADDEPTYPVLILLVGLSAYRQVQTFQVEELVSHGYIVAAIDHPYAAAAVVFPDGRQVDFDSRMFDRAYFDAHIPYLVQDADFTLDQLTALNEADPNGILTGRLDLQRVGMFGHSLGGIVGAEFCRIEPRLKACLLEDAFMPPDVVRAGLQHPTMWITRDAETMRLERRTAGGWKESDIEEHLTTMRAVYESLRADGYYVQVPGMFHLDMTDAPLLTPLASNVGLGGPVGGQRSHTIINAYSVAFFDRYLKGQLAPLLDGPSEQYPEVVLEARHP